MKTHRFRQLGLAVVLSVLTTGAWAQARMIDEIEQLVAVLRDKPLTESEVTANMLAIWPNWQPIELASNGPREPDEWAFGLGGESFSEDVVCFYLGEASLARLASEGRDAELSPDHILNQAAITLWKDRIAVKSFPTLAPAVNGIPVNATGLLMCGLHRSDLAEFVWEDARDRPRLEALFTYAVANERDPNLLLAVLANDAEKSDRYLRLGSLTVAKTALDTTSVKLAGFSVSVFILDPGQS